MVFEDTDADLPLGKLPHLDLYVQHNQLNFQQGALKMHTESGLLDEYFVSEQVPMEEVVDRVKEWLFELGYSENEEGMIEIVVAGKNYNAFDKLFLQEVWEWKTSIKEHRRTLDPAILYVDWNEDDVPPNLLTCLQRMADYQNSGVEHEVSHDALEDAFDVIRVIRASNDPMVYNKVGT